LKDYFSINFGPFKSLFAILYLIFKIMNLYTWDAFSVLYKPGFFVKK
jgi:DNA phosphorothioation-dependent restriction protein DptG